MEVERLFGRWWALFLMGTIGCAVNPPPQGQPLSADAGAERFATADEVLTLSATASGGTMPYSFRWNVEIVPAGEEVQPIPDSESAEVATLPFVVGRYVYRVLVTDAEGRTAVDFVAIDVGPGLAVEIVRDEAEGNGLFVDEPSILTAEPNQAGDFTYLWRRISGVEVEFGTPEAAQTTVTALAAGEVVIAVAVTAVGGEQTVGQEVRLVVLDGDRPRVLMTVASESAGVNGEVVFELFADAAPGTVANFLRYIDAGFYEGVVWHRVSSSPDGTPFVVQTGGFVRSGESLATKEPLFDPVEGEPDNGISNTQDTIAMALVNNDSDSGTSQFFINQADNSFLDENFTVFGQVVGGHEIVEAMTMLETGSAEVVGGGAIGEVPLMDVTITRFVRE